jgi:hypothetical protein
LPSLHGVVAAFTEGHDLHGLRLARTILDG